MGEPRMRVAMVIARFPPHLGGTERQALELARELVRRGVGVDVVTQRSNQAHGEENIDGVQVHRLKPGGNALWKSGLFVLNGFKFFFQMRMKPDIFHGHMIASTAVLACMAQRFFGGKSIVKIACSGSFGEVRTSRKNWMGRWKLRFVLRHAERLVCVSQEALAEILDAGVPAGRAVYIPNGVNTDFFSPVGSSQRKSEIAMELGLPAGRWILFSGRFNDQKQPGVLVDAFVRLAADFPDVKLLLLGEGPDEASLRDRIHSQRLEGRVFLRSTIDRMSDYYRLCDVFVLTSQAEGLSNSLLEAMSSGLICIATRIGGNVDVIEEGQSGFLFDPMDVNGLVAVLRNVLAPSFSQEKISGAARRRIVEKFSLSVVSGRYHELYRLLMNEKQHVETSS